jgi:hypothetical protein
LSSIFSNTQLQTLLSHKFLLEVSFNTPPVDILSAAAKSACLCAGYVPVQLVRNTNNLQGRIAKNSCPLRKNCQLIFLLQMQSCESMCPISLQLVRKTNNLPFGITIFCVTYHSLFRLEWIKFFSFLGLCRLLTFIYIDESRTTFVKAYEIKKKVLLGMC